MEDDDPIYLPWTKDQAISSIRRLLQLRHYRTVEPEYELVPPTEEDDMWRIHTVHENGQDQLLTVFTNTTRTGGDVMDVEEFASDHQRVKESLPNTSAKFIQTVVEECRAAHIASLIIVSDNVTSQAYKAIKVVTDMHITVFSYAELCVGSFDQHIYQPLSMIKSSSIELPSKADHECTPISEDDILMRYHGFRAGDRIEVVECDRQSGRSSQTLRVI